MGDLQNLVTTMKNQISSITVTGSAGAGMVEVVMNGTYQVQSVSINESILNDKSTLEVLIASAFNDGVNKAKNAVDRSIQERAMAQEAKDDKK